MNVLDSLQPHLNLKKLSIELYGGLTFPSRITYAEFNKIVDIRLVNCRKCTSLPCLRFFPSLTH